jgi:hypothetical protein
LEYCFILVKFAADLSASAIAHSIHPPPRARVTVTCVWGSSKLAQRFAR